MRQNDLICATFEKITINEAVREALAISLLRLMGKKDFNKITITEISLIAGVGRSSFYRNYESKEDLLCDYIINLYKKYFNNNNVPHTIHDASSIDDFLIPRFKFIYTYKNIFRALYNSNTLLYFFKKIEKNFLLILCGQYDNISPYYCAMFAGSCASIISQWIERDFKENIIDMTELFKKPLVFFNEM